VVPERDVDCGELYEQVRQRFLEVERSCDATARATVVPATPAWTVHDVLSHLVGITVDLNAGNFGGTLDPDAWTAAQVDARRGSPVDALAADGPALAVGLDFYLISLEQTLTADGVGAVEISVAEESWILGSGAPVASVRAERFELFRALGGRRTDGEIRALRWRGAAVEIVPRLSRYPAPLASLGE
jgi:hypothetical protein